MTGDERFCRDETAECGGGNTGGEIRIAEAVFILVAGGLLCELGFGQVDSPATMSPATMLLIKVTHRLQEIRDRTNVRRLGRPIGAGHRARKPRRFGRRTIEIAAIGKLSVPERPRAGRDGYFWDEMDEGKSMKDAMKPFMFSDFAREIKTSRQQARPNWSYTISF
jgi:hypothetical protein